MVHTKRGHRIRQYDDLEMLAEHITEQTWTGCTGFRYRNLLFLNDAFGADGAQEYAVVQVDPTGSRPPMQVESYTCSWMKPEDFVRYVQRALEPGWIPPYRDAVVTINPHRDGSCRACA